MNSVVNSFLNSRWKSFSRSFSDTGAVAWNPMLGLSLGIAKSCSPTTDYGVRFFDFVELEYRGSGASPDEFVSLSVVLCGYSISNLTVATSDFPPEIPSTRTV